MLDDPLYYTIPIAGIIGLLFAGYLTWWILRKDTGTPEMKAISDAIREGAMAYLARQYKTIAIISVILGVLITVGINLWTGVAFLLGAFFSALSGYIGMYVSVSSNIRTASAARRSLNEALLTSFRGGAVSGIAVVALSLMGVAGIFFLYQAYVAVGAPGSADLYMDALFLAVGYAFGASFAALFAQLGGGIYTKAADVGADLVGKVEAGIPEDDPRNPAVIADLVGDNVGDCAGRGADLFESTAAENIGAMILGIAIFAATGNPGWFMFPLVVRGFGLLAGLVGIMAVRMKNEDENPMKAINRGYYVTSIIAAILFYFAVDQMLEGKIEFFICGMIGIALSVVIVYITQYYTAGEYRPVKKIAKASETGPATNIIAGISIGMETTAMSVLAIAISLIASFELGVLASPDAAHEFIYGLYGTAVATMGMLATCAFVLAEDTFGPITDNAGGIVEMSGQPEEVRVRTDRLDSIGNTTKALTKGYAMGAAALAAYLLFGAFFEQVAKIREIDILAFYNSFTVDLLQPVVFVSALIGAMLVYLFTSLAISAVGKAAGDMIAEVRRQFKEKPGILAGTEKPDYATCVDISTKGALKAMILPGILPVVVPVALGLILRYGFPDNNDYAVMGVGAFLMVATIAGVLMALFLNNGGGAWDNAKKYIEAKGLKGTPQHAAGVVGDTVGDPFKDTAGPSLHVLVKLLSTITLVFAVLFVV
ncbi:MAG: K(+)-stimulated pyrophosphate-energized sodium pump [Methanomassiliicoccales archaeon PtaB.Bin134]|nr:MAG: K(+)-stimulated pyrophosphate-energized sodium pump [Methanomassiliicoccales archaeon PtaB.Bin134]